MNVNQRYRALMLVIAIGCLSLAGMHSAMAADPKIGDRLSVMTQNLYVGANLFKILEATTPDQVPYKAAEIFSDIQATDFAQRADAIAKLVAHNRPDLIALQEVSLIRTQCPDDIVSPPYNAAPNAEEVYADYLQILLDALAARGLDYEVAALVNNADFEVPVLNIGLLDCGAQLFDARLTDRDVTLRRADVDVTYTIVGNYLANLPVPTAAGTVVFTRGYNIVDVVKHGRSYRFVNTHLEVNEDPAAITFQSLQAMELAQTLDALPELFGDKVLVVAGDFNSDPNEGPLVPCLLPPTFSQLGECPTPYAVMSDNEFIDTWMLRNARFDEGETCCQEALLTNPESELYARYDQVWARAPEALRDDPRFLRAVHADVIGDQVRDLSIDSLWLSDHGGVVVDMTVFHAR